MNAIKSVRGDPAGRARSISAPSDESTIFYPPRSSFPTSLPGLPADIPIASHYQNVAIPDSCSQSHPASPRLAPHKHPFHGVSASYPVFPHNAQKYYATFASYHAKPVREAILFTKNRDGVTFKEDGAPASPNDPQKGPKMHLFASRKVQKKQPREEDFPVPPVEWLVGGSKSNESSLVSSETQSRDSSEDESEESVGTTASSPCSAPSTPVLVMNADSVQCHILSLGLKALLKVSA